MYELKVLASACGGMIVAFVLYNVGKDLLRWAQAPKGKKPSAKKVCVIAVPLYVGFLTAGLLVAIFPWLIR